MSGLFGGGGGGDMPTSTAGNVKRTAEPTEQLSETARKNKRLKASFLTQGFEPPTLAKAGLLGI